MEGGTKETCKNNGEILKHRCTQGRDNKKGPSDWLVRANHFLYNSKTAHLVQPSPTSTSAELFRLRKPHVIVLVILTCFLSPLSGVVCSRCWPDAQLQSQGGALPQELLPRVSAIYVDCKQVEYGTR